MPNDIHAATQAIREALAAGPTVGPWQIIKSYGSGARCSIKAGHARIAVPSVTNLNWEANAALIAACNPEAITTILAALEARDAEIAALREVLVNARQALQQANDAGSGGPIQDTIWMPAKISSAETLFDYLDAAIAQTTVQTRHGDSHIALPDTSLKDRTVRAMLTHYEKWGDTEGFGQMVAAVAALFRGDGGKERKG